MASAAGCGHDVNPFDRLGDREDDPHLLESRERFQSWVGPIVATLSFWGAIALPVIYLPLLAVGIDDASGLLAFLGLFGLHVVTLVAGRSHRAETRR